MQNIKNLLKKKYVVVEQDYLTSIERENELFIKVLNLIDKECTKYRQEQNYSGYTGLLKIQSEIRQFLDKINELDPSDQTEI